jgi:hypothetical protein
MTIPLLIAIAFSLGFYIESIIGFGGGLIAYSILGLFMDIKSMVLVGLYIGTCASAYIVITDHKSFSKKVFLSTLPVCFLGTIIGVLIFTKIDSKTMLIALGGLLIILSTKIMFFDNLKFPKLFKNSLLAIGGISHGLFGIGGPFVVNAVKDDFKSKSELRTTMAVFFVSLNIVRFIQLFAQKTISIGFFSQIWWTIIPVFVAIFLGFKAHLRISELFFKRMIGAMTFFAGIVFLLK